MLQLRRFLLCASFKCRKFCFNWNPSDPRISTTTVVHEYLFLKWWHKIISFLLSVFGRFFHETCEFNFKKQIFKWIEYWKFLGEMWIKSEEIICSLSLHPKWTVAQCVSVYRFDNFILFIFLRNWHHLLCINSIKYRKTVRKGRGSDNHREGGDLLRFESKKWGQNVAKNR